MRIVFTAILVVSIFLIFYELGYKRGEMVHRKFNTIESHTITEIKYTLIPETYGSLIVNKAQSWNSFPIETKMFLCAFGSSGNSFSESDMKEIQEKWGPK